jgi:hypothetical protein
MNKHYVRELLWRRVAHRFSLSGEAPVRRRVYHMGLDGLPLMLHDDIRDSINGRSRLQTGGVREAIRMVLAEKWAT